MVVAEANEICDSPFLAILAEVEVVPDIALESVSPSSPDLLGRRLSVLERGPCVCARAQHARMEKQACRHEDESRDICVRRKQPTRDLMSRTLLENGHDDSCPCIHDHMGMR